MRVYHFLPSAFALDDLRRRRLKIARANDFNDPFEFISPALADRRLRNALHNARNIAHAQFGFLCFSRDWQNPVQWSHYADRHRGIAFGFDVEDRHLATVNYSPDRLQLTEHDFDHDDPAAAATMLNALHTKYIHWEYEQEVRLMLHLNEPPAVAEGSLYFLPFGEGADLREVIIGARCDIGRDEIYAALGNMRKAARVKKVRCAFQSYTMVEDLRWRRQGATLGGITPSSNS